MKAPVPRLSDTHRRTLGSRLAMMQRLISQARELGFDTELLTELETELARIEEDVEAIRPVPPPHQVRAALAELLLLVERALDELEEQSKQEVIARALSEDPGRDRR